ncbi:MAG: hypothetical protein KME27_01580 [Lyngbya sp. HA4199-MV5]|nr:hypothetical protein [Lyngbya sp. HA4199-MV5]
MFFIKSGTKDNSNNRDELSALAEFWGDRPSTTRHFTAPTAALEGICRVVSLTERRSIH